MSATPTNAVKVVQASNLPGTLDEIVLNGPAFQFFQWGLSDAPASEKIDIYRLDVVDHYIDPELRYVLDLNLKITNNETGTAVDLFLTRRSNGRFSAFYDGKIADIGDLPTYFDSTIELPKSPPPARTYSNIHDRLKARIIEHATEIKSSFEDDEPDTGFKM
jgi:hypothetical protein